MTKQTKTNSSFRTALSALALLAIASLAPACDIFNPDPCDPEVEICPFTGNHPGTLADPVD